MSAGMSIVGIILVVVGVIVLLGLVALGLSSFKRK